MKAATATGPATAAAAAGKTSPPSGTTTDRAATTTGPIRDAVPVSARSGGRGGLLAASLIGGLVGAGLALGTERFLLPPRPDNATAARMTALENRVAALPTASPAAALEPRLAALETGLREAVEAARGARAAADAAAKQAGEALSRPAPDAPAAAAADTGLRDAVTALTARVDESATQARGNAAAIGELGTKLDALGTRSGEGVAAVQAAVQAIQAAVSAVQGGVRSLQADVQGLKTSAGALDTRAGQVEARLAALSTDLARVAGDVGKLSPAAVQAGLRVVISGRLDDALRSGTPLGPVLLSLARFGADPAAIAALQPFAEAPAPSSAALAAEFKPLADRLTAVPQGPSESWLDRIRRVFERVVTVRAVGDGSGSDLPGLVARIETALTRGQLPAAEAAWDQLPADAKAMSQGWAARLKARVAADAAARSIAVAALAALDTATR